MLGLADPHSFFNKGLLEEAPSRIYRRLCNKSNVWHDLITLLPSAMNVKIKIKGFFLRENTDCDRILRSKDMDGFVHILQCEECVE